MQNVDKLSFTTTVLKNGHILHTQQNSQPVTYLRMSIPVGSAHSHSGNKNCTGGCFHFLEHMCFERSHLNPDKAKYLKLLATTGSSQNACTDAFFTVFNFESPSHTFSSSFPAFLNKISAPSLLEDDIKLQRDIIKNERNQRKYFPGDDELSHYFMTKWKDISYYPKEQLFGSDADLKSLTPEKLKLIHSYYFNSPIHIFIAGNFEEDFVKKELEKLPSTLNLSTLIPKVSTPRWINQNFHEYHSTDIEKPVYFIGGIYVDFTMEDFWAVDFILQMLSHDEFGTLQNWIRKENGWSYGLEPNLECEKGRVVWSIKIPLESTDIVEKVRSEIHSRIKTSIGDIANIIITKERLLLQMCFDLETISSRLDAAVMTFNLTDTTVTEQDYKNWLANTVSHEYILSMYQRHFAPNKTGEFLAIP